MTPLGQVGTPCPQAVPLWNPRQWRQTAVPPLSGVRHPILGAPHWIWCSMHSLCALWWGGQVLGRRSYDAYQHPF